MGDLNFLQKLLDGVGVEWKSIEEITLPTKNIKWREVEGVYRYIDLSSVSIETKKITETLEVNAINAPSRAQKIIQKDDIIFATTRPTQKRYCLIEDDYSGDIASTGYCVLRAKKDEVLPKWIFYWIASSNFNKYTEENQSGSAYPSISDAKVKEFKIPIPCPDNPKKSLEIQAEIVRILDAMTAHTAELTAELTARKKQYDYYRDKLLSFEGIEMEWKTLGDIGDVKMCKRILKNQTHSEGDVPFYKIGTFGKKADAFISNEIYEEYKNKYSFPNKGDILISASGTIGRTVVYDGTSAYFQDSNIVWLSNDEKIVSNKYLWHFYKIAKWSVSEGGTIDRLYNDNIRKTKIPVPFPSDPAKSLVEQARVVSILDKLDKLTSSLTEGLPREIELRQKQYAYYRDLLLSFPKLEEVMA